MGPPLEDPEAVLVIDAPGVLNTGRHARGTAGRLETCPMGVWLGEARRLGHTWLDREL